MVLLAGFQALLLAPRVRPVEDELPDQVPATPTAIPA